MRELTLNRPVHLAARDACYERAVKLLRADLMSCEVTDRLGRLQSICDLLHQAQEHADFALRGMTTGNREKLFLRYLELLGDSVHSLVVLTRHEHLLISDRDLFRDFLASDPQLLDRSANEYRQLAERLLEETLHLVGMAVDEVRKLKEENRAELQDPEAHNRYQRAYESFGRAAT